MITNHRLLYPKPVILKKLDPIDFVQLILQQADSSSLFVFLVLLIQ